MGDTETFFQVSDLKEFLKGIWWLKRQLHDHGAGQEGQLVGSAVFSPSGSDLHYSEKGHLVIGEHAGSTLQSYRYSFPAPAGEAPTQAAVHFRDGRFFHHLDLSRGAWACTHLCDPDRYTGEFTVLDAERWRVVWRVSGPRKDLTLDSTYRRAL